MSIKKQSFVLYNDYFESFAALEREERGDLIMAIFEYQRDGNITTDLSPSCKIAFTFIKSQLERDNEKYQNTVIRNRTNGAKGGRPTKNPKNPSGYLGNPKKPKKPDNDNDNEYENDNNRVINHSDHSQANNLCVFEERFSIFWKAYPRKTAKTAARKAFMKLKPDNELLSKMLSALEVQKRSEQWTKDNGAFIPHPSTWINGKRWEDEDTQPHSPYCQSDPHDWDWASNDLEDNK